MKKPSDANKISDEELAELECKFYELAYKLVGDFGMSIKAAGEIAEQMIGLQILDNLKSELEALV